MEIQAPKSRNLNPRALETEAIKLATAGQWQEALEVNTEYIETSPEDSGAYNRLGKALMELGRYSDAQTAFSRGLNIDPGNTIARKNLQRLETLAGKNRAPPSVQSKVVPHHFIEETGKAGVWQDAPSDEILYAIMDVAQGKMIVAEDLGIIPESVTDLRKQFGLPGMAVLHFAFDDDNSDNPHRPESITEDRIVYTGTHDNDTTLGWWKSSSPERRERVQAMGLAGESACQTLIRLALESASPLAMIPLQDILELPSEARMNTPGTEGGNWAWRFDWTEFPEAWPEFTARATRVPRGE